MNHASDQMGTSQFFKRLPCVPGWCVRCWEAGQRKHAWEWILFTTVPVTDAASAWERLEWYRWRWVVEEYHKALKTGCARGKCQNSGLSNNLPLKCREI